MDLNFFVIIFSLILLYLSISFILVFIFAKIPRTPYPDEPDWGEIKDLKIKTRNGKKIELWVVEPDDYDNDPDKPAIILMHGWGRNRGRMVSRARVMGKLGFTTIIVSARDHGNSDKEFKGMSIMRFSNDIDDCISWWNKPVIIDGHSVGAGAVLIVAARNPLVKGVIAEAPPYAFPASFGDIYRPALGFMTPFFLPGIIFVFKLIGHNYKREDFSPNDVSSKIKVPTLLIHGKNDEIFPYEFTKRLASNIKDCKVWFPVCGHSDIEFQQEYPQVISDFLDFVLTKIKAN
ncbi:MAG: alpha/beta hydrolase [Candidatus Hodarchaeales archaeon]